MCRSRPITTAPYPLTLAPYSFLWLELQAPTSDAKTLPGASGCAGGRNRWNGS